jgi:Flp pilus assembly protein TadG
MNPTRFRPRERAPRTGRRASVLLEFAFVVPILVTLAVGALEVARAIMVRQVLSDAVRKGCRTAVLPSGTNASITQDVNDVLTLNNINAAAATPTILVNGQSVDASTAKQNDQVSVKVSIPFSAVSWTSPIFLKNGNVESVTLVMLRQG